MEKAGDLMRALGLREDADDELKKTLLRSMAKFAHDAETRRRFLTVKKDEQLVFDFEESPYSTKPTSSTLKATTG